MTDATETTLPGEPVDPRAGQRRLLVILAGGLVLVVLVIAALALLGGDDDETAGPTTTAPSEVSPTSPPTSVPALGPVSAETFEVFATKNPFLPLRTAGGAAAPAGGAGPPTGGAAAAPAPARTGGATTGPAGGVEPRRGARVALLDVFAEGAATMANVRVNDTVHKVTAGQVFAGNFKVVSLSQAEGCGRFLFGDDSFRLCKGEETLK
jgi:hypothetical protein